MRVSPVSLTTASAALVAALALASQGTPPASAQDAMDQMMGGSGKVERDPAYFREHVLPILATNCLGCHDATDPDNETRHKLTPNVEGQPFTEEEVQKNYENVVGLLHPTNPARSRLLQKLVPMPWGGIDHDGGKADGDDFPMELIDAKGPLVAWAFGGSKGQAPPVAVTAPVPRQVTVGEEVRLDGSLSFDPDGKDVTVRWRLSEAPLGAQAAVKDPVAKVTSITPDRPGPYVLRLEPKDDKLRGWPRRVRFAAVAKTGTPTTDGSKPADRIDSDTRQLTRALFLDMYGRTPGEDELALIAGMPYEKRVDFFLADRASWQHWFDEESFYFLLIDQFRPVSDRLAAVPEKIRDGIISFRDAHTEFALSAEFNARNPGNDTYVTVVFEQFLGIEVQNNVRLLETAKKMYDGKQARIFGKKGTTQSDVVHISLAQPDYVDLFVRRMERRYLGEELPDAEHKLWVERLEAHPRDFPKILREWLMSERYTAKDRAPKSKTDHQFIRSLYVDLLGRPPSYEEFRNMRNALQALADPTPLRGVLAKVMLDSGAVIPPKGDDPSLHVTQLFHRLLGRDPSRREMAAFTGVLKEPGATWRTAALALLNSPHYQYY